MSVCVSAPALFVNDYKRLLILDVYDLHSKLSLLVECILFQRERERERRGRERKGRKGKGN